jgi:hypothetical protein
MYWDAELVPYCGGTYRVLKRVSKLIIEQTGKMQEMKNPCIILDNVVCQARYTTCRMLCPKSMYPYWREIWLERVGANSGDLAGDKHLGSEGIPGGREGALLAERTARLAKHSNNNPSDRKGSSCISL